MCDCLEPVTILQNIRKAGIPSERRDMRHLPQDSGRGTEMDSLAGCWADFVVLLDDSDLVGIQKHSQDNAVLGILHSHDTESIGLYCQLEMLKSFPPRLLILEGRLARKFLQSVPAIYALQYWCFQNHIFIVHTSNNEGPTKMLEVLFRRIQSSLNELEPASAPDKNA